MADDTRSPIDDLEPLLDRIARVDARAMVWCAALCARSVLYIAGESRGQPLGALEAAEALALRSRSYEGCSIASKEAGDILWNRLNLEEAKDIRSRLFCKNEDTMYLPGYGAWQAVIAASSAAALIPDDESEGLPSGAYALSAAVASAEAVRETVRRIEPEYLKSSWDDDQYISCAFPFFTVHPLFLDYVFLHQEAIWTGSATLKLFSVYAQRVGAPAALCAELSPEQAYAQHLTDLHAQIASSRWPLAHPSPHRLYKAPKALQVSWDYVVDERTEHTMLELLEAHARCKRLHLDWSNEVQRAVAERTTDEHAVRALLGPPP